MYSALFCGALLLDAGCSSGPEKRPNVSYRTSAKENFLKGKQELEDEDWLEAIEYFKFVKNKFPYSEYATQADLLLADCHYGRERYIEAAEAYESFIKLHPRHPKVPYAQFRVGMCYFKRIPDDWWFAPPAYELDQTETVRAVGELQRYLRLYPQDENTKEAKELLDQTLTRLAQQVRYVMNFYYKRHSMRAVLWRAEEMLKNYPGLGFDEEALFRKGEAQVVLGERDGAKTTFQTLLEKFPQGKLANDARKQLERLQTEKGTQP